MKIFSHRGLHHNATENTLEAFEAAIALGIDGIETDIRVSADGIPVLHHDPCLANGNEISGLTFTQINQQSPYPIPQLEEALALEVPLQFCWNLELKTIDSFRVATQVLKHTKVKTPILFTSFWHDGIVAMIKDKPYLKRSHFGLLWASHPFNFEQPQWFEEYPDITTLVFYQERLSLELIQACHLKGLDIGSYGDQSPTDISRLKSLGIDLLITDRPRDAQNQKRSQSS